jgi:RNA polymerase sigma-70 factor (ECF subfamily)
MDDMGGVGDVSNIDLSNVDVDAGALADKGGVNSTDDVEHMDEAALAMAAAAGTDPQAFALLYTRYLRPVFGYCYVRLQDRHAAEDATSEVFLKALANLSGYRGGAFAAWLFRIAHNVVADFHRRSRRDHRDRYTAPATGDDMDRSHGVQEALGSHTRLMSGDPDPFPTPEEYALMQAEYEALRLAMDSLSYEQRTVLELQLAGWSGRQIADALGKSAAAVKSLRFRALARLRLLLQAVEPSVSPHHAGTTGASAHETAPDQDTRGKNHEYRYG